MRSAARWPAAMLVAVAMAGAAVAAEPEAADVPAAAPKAIQPVHWRCWHSALNADAISCRVTVPDALAVAELEAPPLVTHPSTLYTIRTAPELLQGELVLIPLYGPPVDWERVARLARVALCAGRTGCTVDFNRLPPG